MSRALSGIRITPSTPQRASAVWSSRLKKHSASDVRIDILPGYERAGSACGSPPAPAPRAGANAENTPTPSASTDSDGLVPARRSLRLSLGGTFNDPATERMFREGVLRAVLEQRALVLTLALTLAGLAIALTHKTAGRREQAPATWALASIAALLAVYTACTRLRRLPLVQTEAVLTLCLCAVAVLMPSSVARGGEYPVHAVRDAELTTLWLAEHLALLIATAIYVPIRTPAFALLVLCAASTAGATLVAAMRGISDDEAEDASAALMYSTVFGVYAAAALSLLGARARLGHLERAGFHLSHTLNAALEDQQSMQSAESTAELRLQTARAASQARSRLIRMVMHDLRSPLLSVTSLACMLRDEAEAADQAEPAPRLTETHVLEALEGLETCAELMEHIVSDMLDFERIESGRLILVEAPFELDELLRWTRVTFGAVAAGKGLQFDTHPPPPGLASVRLVGDVRRLQQCLNNGVSNALKFTESGGRVTVHAFEGHTLEAEEALPADGSADAPSPRGPLRTVHVCVDDTGVGLDTAELDTLRGGAEPFAQVGKGQLQGSGGTGLGLSITRQLLALHNGSTMRLSSTGHAQGTRFEMILRLREHTPSGSASSGALAPELAKLALAQVRADGASSRMRSRMVSSRRSTEYSVAGDPSRPPSEPSSPPLYSLRHRTLSPMAAPLDLTADADTETSPSEPEAEERAERAAEGEEAAAVQEREGLHAAPHAPEAQPPTTPDDASSGSVVPSPQFAERTRTMRRSRARSEHLKSIVRFGGQPQQAQPAEPPPSAAGGAGGHRRGPAFRSAAEPRAPDTRAVLDGSFGQRSERSERSEPGHVSWAADGRGGVGAAVAAWRGSAVAEDAERHGAEPRAAATPPPSDAHLTSASGVARATKKSGRLLSFPPDFRCLHVEDDRILQRALPLRTFKKVGAPFDTASDGAEAVEMVLHGAAEYALIVMDNQMPRMSGILATRALRRGGFRGLIIGMTGDPQGSPDRDEFEAAGLDACLDKDAHGIESILTVLRSCALMPGDNAEARQP